jgi:hypothetical protein
MELNFTLSLLLIKKYCCHFSQTFVSIMAAGTCGEGGGNPPPPLDQTMAQLLHMMM